MTISRPCALLDGSDDAAEVTRHTHGQITGAFESGALHETSSRHDLCGLADYNREATPTAAHSLRSAYQNLRPVPIPGETQRIGAGPELSGFQHHVVRALTRDGRYGLARFVYQLGVEIVPLQHVDRDYELAFSIPPEVMIPSRDLLGQAVARFEDDIIEGRQNLEVAHRAVANLVPEVRQSRPETVALETKVKRDAQVVGQNLTRKRGRDFKHERFPGVSGKKGEVRSVHERPGHRAVDKNPDVDLAPEVEGEAGGEAPAAELTYLRESDVEVVRVVRREDRIYRLASG